MSKYIDERSDVKSTSIGKGSRIWQYVVILPGAQIGMHCNICAHCFIENRVKIGNHVTIKCGVSVWDEVTIEDNVFIGPNVSFTNDIYPRSGKHKQKYLPTIIKHNASLGANSTILAGIVVGEYALIGAGAVVTKSVPAYTVWVGNPARNIGYICKCGGNITESLICESCGVGYELFNSSIREKSKGVS